MAVCCPYCNSDKMYWSRSGNRGVRSLIQLFVTVARCHRCGRQTHLRGPFLLGPTLELPEGCPSRRWVVYAVLSLPLFVGAVWCGLGWQRVAAPDSGPDLRSEPLPRSIVAEPATARRPEAGKPTDPLKWGAHHETPKETQSPKPSPKQADEFRIWRDVKKREIRARFVTVDDLKVTLEREDGKVVKLPLRELSQLSDEDQKFVRAKIMAEVPQRKRVR